MLTRLAIALALFFALATTAKAQPAANFPPPTGPGDPQAIPSSFATCTATVKRDANGYPIRQIVRECMESKGFSLIYGDWACDGDPPTDPVGRKYKSRIDCQQGDRGTLPDNPTLGDTYFPTPWQPQVQPVTFDPASPAARLLLLAKRVADSGETDDPASVARLLHLSITLSTRNISSPASCAESPDQSRGATNTYIITGNSWFHALPSGKRLIVYQPDPEWHNHPDAKPKTGPIGDPKIEYLISGSLACRGTSPQNGISATITFDNIPAYACIDFKLAATILPPGPSSILGGPGTDGYQGPDMAYASQDSIVFFNSTFGPPWAVPSWWTKNSDTLLNQPNCLKTIEIASRYPFGPRHKFDFTDKPSMPNTVAVPPTPPNSKTPSADPGGYLLKAVKALADSPRIADPTSASSIVHLPFVLTSHYENGAVSCVATPQGNRFTSAHYKTTADGWFHPLPTGKRLLVSAPVYVPGNDFARATVPLDDPSFSYDTDRHAGCTPSPNDLVDFGITFDNIPAYACITEQQVKSVFTGVHPPSRAENQLRPDLVYLSAYAMVDFSMTTNRSASAGAVPLSGEPTCLKKIQLYALSDLESYKKQLAQMDLEQKEIDKENRKLRPIPPLSN
jgi:hypothetical protein